MPGQCPFNSKFNVADPSQERHCVSHGKLQKANYRKCIIESMENVEADIGSFNTFTSKTKEVQNETLYLQHIKVWLIVFPLHGHTLGFYPKT